MGLVEISVLENSVFLPGELGIGGPRIPWKALCKIHSYFTCVLKPRGKLHFVSYFTKQSGVCQGLRARKPRYLPFKFVFLALWAINGCVWAFGYSCARDLKVCVFTRFWTPRCLPHKHTNIQTHIQTYQLTTVRKDKLENRVLTRKLRSFSQKLNICPGEGVPKTLINYMLFDPPAESQFSPVFSR